MKPNNLILKVYGERRGSQWTLICLDFSLAAQADTLPQAKAILHSQIKEYLTDALEGQDREFAAALLTRRAPIKYFAKWWIGNLAFKFFKYRDAQQKAFLEPVHMKPA